MQTVPTQPPSRRPILIGLVVVIATVAIGVAAAFATGMAQPLVAKAFDVLPPCCTVPPPPPPVILPPPPPPPVPIIPDVLPPCCTEEPAPTPPPAPVTPTPDVLPPCCTEEPAAPVPPPPVTPVPDVLPPCCTTETPIVPVPPVTTPPVPVVPPIVPETPIVPVTPPPVIPPPVIPPPVIPPPVTPPPVTPPPVTTPDQPACVQLTASPTTITSAGQDVTLSWIISNASTITISNVNTFTGLTGSVTVNPTGDTTYVGTVPDAPANPACQASVSLDDDDDNGGGGNGGGGNGGGGRRNPRVVFDSVSRPAEAPLGSVFLSEVPYTGLDLGPVGTAVYWTVLTLWSLAAAYLVLFGAVPFVRRKLAMAAAAAAMPPEHSMSAAVMPETSIPSVQPVQAPEVATAHAHIDPIAPQPAAQPIFAVPGKAEFTGEGFKRFASATTLTIEDIVKGLSRESGMEFAAPAAPSEPARMLPEHAAAAPIAMPAPQPAPRIEQPVPPTIMVNDDIMGFINALLAGERDQVFGLIRRLNQAGHDVEEFMAHAICALDDAYRARIDGTPVHEDVKRATEHCATPFLERLVSSLTTAVDGSYSMGVTGIKLAVTRALAVANG